MSNFYETRQKQFYEKYWLEQTPGLINVNGFKDYPMDIYNSFLQYLEEDGNVLDLGCGNGLLLRHLTYFSNLNVVPYGVDFLEQSIEQAKEEILPQFNENFYCCSIDLFSTEIKFKYIILEPYLLYEKDRKSVVEKLKNFLAPGGSIIIYNYHDALKNEKIEDLFHYPGLEGFNFEKYNRFDIGLDIAYLVV
ncbi:class I SAM-dependent methyltransferase [Candidatus Falkowbacteria bacterium]|jgi:2-polyprenyl-3-methyl-5-hydroxy-6-metoxy-1,4-benzoquinol methylase|nr:class I SAM-dependent methyltransferase [Candidatus Falkowbacteria bacterium]MBT5503667.1 class I SAM-dependent methyltransferase [Candidatus Falkowbacteria bacterium]MBT6574455.1 class I SAM-dependent methyltransferase [Candidatus Falkowbacteria bacterium]MBT7348806.1 class I SAM-dependent methyltransferase [Candidatus Falkowbacteria bacterium]MBT7501227.1 class I SAM-dependent methyltransferase [Candidatus Falkowbacteria bacterium]